MAPNGTSRKTPAPMANGKPSIVNFVPKSLYDDGFSISDKASKLKVKEDVTKRIPKINKPGNWDSEITNKFKDASVPARPLAKVPLESAKAFANGRPMDDKLDLVKCNHCRRAILRHRAKAHVEDCIAKKQEKQRRKKEAKDARDADRRRAERGGESSSEEEEIGGPGSKTARKTDGTEGGKKRKAEDTAEGGLKKKKKKDEPKAKAPRPKAPVDVEKQCGVELPQGGQCARSLTCKSHSMGAKRAVPGRSAPYDKLLAEYQRKNQAKLQKAAMESQPLLPDDELAPSGPIDSDEEKDLVLAAIARARPQPLYQTTCVPLRRKYQHVRLKEMLGNALSGRGGGLFGTASG